MLNSKEALEHICKSCDNDYCPYIHYEKSRCAFYGVIRQDLDRLKMLEEILDILRDNVGTKYFKLGSITYNTLQEALDAINTRLEALEP